MALLPGMLSELLLLQPLVRSFSVRVLLVGLDMYLSLGGVGSQSIAVRGATTLVSLPLLVVLVLIQDEQGNRMYFVLE